MHTYVSHEEAIYHGIKNKHCSFWLHTKAQVERYGNRLDNDKQKSKTVPSRFHRAFWEDGELTSDHVFPLIVYKNELLILFTYFQIHPLCFHQSHFVCSKLQEHWRGYFELPYFVDWHCCSPLGHSMVSHQV